MTGNVAERLAERLGGFSPKVLLTLGSGLAGLAQETISTREIPFDDIGLPGPTVPGHSGRLLAGSLQGVPVLVQQGRVHLYEGVAVGDVTACVRAAAAVGVDTFVVTNAAGGLAADMQPGDIMLLTDHLNLTGTSPLIGLETPLFLDMSAAYDPELLQLVRDAGAATGHHLREGVYAGLVGPTYETPAEVNMLRMLGADAVGMSTVVEVIAARALGLRVAGLSLLTNVHRPGGTKINHEEVLEAGALAGPRLAELLREFFLRLGAVGAPGRLE